MAPRRTRPQNATVDGEPELHMRGRGRCDRQDSVRLNRVGPGSSNSGACLACLAEPPHSRPKRQFRRRGLYRKGRPTRAAPCPTAASATSEWRSLDRSDSAPTSSRLGTDVSISDRAVDAAALRFGERQRSLCLRCRGVDTNLHPAQTETDVSGAEMPVGAQEQVRAAFVP